MESWPFPSNPPRVTDEEWEIFNTGQMFFPACMREDARRVNYHYITRVKEANARLTYDMGCAQRLFDNKLLRMMGHPLDTKDTAYMDKLEIVMAEAADEYHHNVELSHREHVEEMILLRENFKKNWKEFAGTAAKRKRRQRKRRAEGDEEDGAGEGAFGDPFDLDGLEQIWQQLDAQEDEAERDK